ncbi:MAG TPA: sulfatase [Clostridiales bacterium]|nr:sulfatase [Clostridiales bacterium]
MNEKRPNLIFVFADQWRRQAVGFMNEDPVVTPNMDKFADESLIFENAISTFPLCSPHRASLMTGRYPLSTGMFTNCKPGVDVALGTHEICISDVLKKQGYATGYIGKWHLDSSERNFSENPESGAKGWDAYTPPGPKRHGFDFWYSYGANDEHMAPHYWQDSNKAIHINQWSPEHETDVAIKYINDHTKKYEKNPFALFISWNPPHSPYHMLPEKYKELYKDKDISFRPNVKAEGLYTHTYEKIGEGFETLTRFTKDYYAAVSGLDENFGRLLKVLKEQGIEDDTIVVLSSDHGDMMGSHGLMAKHVWLEESIGIPFVIRWPSRILPGREKTLLGSADVMPTLLQLMNIPVPASVEGTDLSPVIRKEKTQPVTSAFICACPGRDVFLKELSAKGIDPKTLGWRGVRTYRYTYVVSKGYFPGEKTKRLLYDNETDPYQLNPLCFETAAENDLAFQMELELKEWLSKLDDPFSI